MNNTGLVSISFRKHTVTEIAEAVENAGLKCIEWGSDVHCKPENTDSHGLINKLSGDHGIKTCAYGSYYRVGVNNETSFEAIADTAVKLSTDIIRVWAFNKGSAETTAGEYQTFIADMKRICGIAAKKNIKISLECHNNTLTDDYSSALRVIEDTACSNLTMYWQPNQHKSLEYNLESAKSLRNYITNVHVFNWDSTARYPLSEAVGTWKKYAEIIEVANNYSHKYLLEFMPCDTIAELTDEADALRKILS